MKPRILSWNVRGLNNRGKCRRIDNLLRGWKPDLVCLLETKLEVVQRAVVRCFLGSPHVRWCHLVAEGASGGILLLWDSQVLELVESCEGIYSISVVFQNVDNGIK